MTYKEFLNSTTDITLLAQFLVNFCVCFYSETLDGICDVSCETSKNSCYGCVEKLLEQEVDTAKLLCDDNRSGGTR